MSDDRLTDEQRYLLVKTKIQKKVEKNTRTQARLFFLFFAVAVIFTGAALPPPPDIVGMLIILIFCFGFVPLIVMVLMASAIKYRTEVEFRKYLEGEDLE